jgi:phosphoglycolate phosphatase
LAVASNKFDAGTKRLVESFFSDIHFKAVYGNREGFPLKPDAALVELIIEECGASREMTYMIGDSGVDVEAAKNGGVRSVGCTWGFRAREELEERGADIIVDRPLDILRVLQ